MNLIDRASTPPASEQVKNPLGQQKVFSPECFVLLYTFRKFCLFSYLLVINRIQVIGCTHV